MSCNTKEKKANKAETDLSTIHVPLKPRSRESKLIPPDFPECLPSSGFKSLENKEVQGIDHQQVQSIETKESSKRYGPVCIVDTKNRKVAAPRNRNESTKFPDKKDLLNSKTEDIQLTKTADFNSHKEVLQNVNIRQDFVQGKGTQNPYSPKPSDEFVASVTIYGTRNALKQLAHSLGAEEMKTGRHGVYTDPRFAQILHNHKDGENLGSGSFGDVTMGKGPNGLEYVRKRVKRDKFQPTEAIFTNVVNHPNIIKTHGLFVEFGTVEIIMDFAGQSLHNIVGRKVLDEGRKALDEDIILFLTLDICSGLAFLESKHVVHFDIKPRNLFVQGDEGKGYLLKIGDFGSAFMPGDTGKMKSFTPFYCAPEMVELSRKRTNPNKISQSQQELEQRLQPKTDIFSAGLVVGFMYERNSLLYVHIKPKDSTKSERKRIIYEYLFDQYTYLKSDLIPKQATQEIQIILEGMLQFNVEKRYSASDSLEHFKALLYSRDREQNTKVTRCFVAEHGEEKKILSGKLGTRSRDVRKKEKLHSSAPQAVLFTDDQLEGFPTKEKKIGLPTQGYQTGSCMQGDQMGLTTKANTQEFNQTALLLGQPMYNVHISDNSYPICQAADDLPVQDPIQKSVPGNLPNLKGFGIDSE